jgi:basic membrane protein A
MGAPGACEAAGVPNVSYNGSTYEACPETFIVSSAINWAPYYLFITKCYAEGTDIPANWCGGITEGSVVLTGINLDVAAEGTVEAIADAIAEFKAGTLNVFDTATFTVGGKTLTNEDNANISDGYFHESEAISAPSFDLRIDGVKFLNEIYE